MTPRAVMLVAASFYPDPMVGAVRVTNWARMLAEQGRRVRVLTRWYGRTATSRAIAEAIGPGVDVVYVNGPAAWLEGDDLDAFARQEPSRSPPRPGVVALKRWLAHGSPSVLAVPDITAIAWKRVSARALDAANAVDAACVITSGPPHGVHEVGRCAKRHGLGWIADFRDPYMFDGRSPAESSLRPLVWPLHARWARAVYTEADAVTHAIPLHARAARRAFGEANVVTLRHTVARLESRAASTNDQLVLRSIGVTTPDSAELLAESVARLRESSPNASMEVLGPVPANAPRLVSKFGPWCAFRGIVPHADALVAVRDADVLLNIVSPERSGHLLVSSKLFEYAPSLRPIICVRASRPDRELARQIGGLRTVHDASPAGLAEALRWAVSPEAAAEAAGPKRRAFCAKYSWSRHAEAFGELIGSVTARR